MRDVEAEREDRPARAQGPASARFRWPELALWLPACALDGAAVAWLAALIGQYRAPLAVFPLLAGLALGVTLAGLMSVCQVGHRPTVLAGLLLAVSVAVVGQHFAAYRQALADTRQHAATYQLARQAFGDEVAGRVPLPPQSFGEFLSRQAARGRPLWGDWSARGAAAWLTWAVDGLLVVAGALLVVVPAWRPPHPACPAGGGPPRPDRAGPGWGGRG